MAEDVKVEETKQEVKQEVVKKQLTVDNGTSLDTADLNGDGHISKEELDMHLEFKRR